VTAPRNVPLHRRVERMLESGDLRLIYGIAVPLAIVIGLIVALAFSGQTWLVAPLVLVLLILTGVVIVGFTQMLDEDEVEDLDEDGHGERPGG
jgi:archaellum biogenesis protein FlaJ (TadC family)